MEQDKNFDTNNNNNNWFMVNELEKMSKDMDIIVNRIDRETDTSFDLRSLRSMINDIYNKLGFICIGLKNIYGSKINDNNPIDVKVYKVKGYNTAKPPLKNKKGDSGCDISFCSSDEFIEVGNDYAILFKGDTKKLPTGLSFDIPEGYELQVRPRSGLSSKGIHVSYGTVDSNYKGQVFVTITNNTNDKIKFENGDRIAQIILSKVSSVNYNTFEPLSEEEESERINSSERGADGFGSTGLK